MTQQKNHAKNHAVDVWMEKARREYAEGLLIKKFIPGTTLEEALALIEGSIWFPRITGYTFWELIEDMMLSEGETVYGTENKKEALRIWLRDTAKRDGLACMYDADLLLNYCYDYAWRCYAHVQKRDCEIWDKEVCEIVCCMVEAETKERMRFEYDGKWKWGDFYREYVWTLCEGLNPAESLNMRRSQIIDAVEQGRRYVACTAS